MQTCQKKAPDPRLWANLWLQGIELWTFGRAVSAVNFWVIHLSSPDNKHFYGVLFIAFRIRSHFYGVLVKNSWEWFLSAGNHITCYSFYLKYTFLCFPRWWPSWQIHQKYVLKRLDLQDHPSTVIKLIVSGVLYHLTTCAGDFTGIETTCFWQVTGMFRFLLSVHLAFS